MDFSGKTPESDLNEENQSLLMEILAAGSGDCLPLIFNCLTSLKDKVRLERVCKTFRKHARSFAAWSNTTSLIIKDKDEEYLINGEYIPANCLESAIQTIVIRIRNVRLINLCDCKQPAAYSSVILTISKQGVGSYRNVKELFMHGNYCENISSNISQFIAMFSCQLLTLLVNHIYFPESAQLTGLLNNIGKCTHLQKLLFLQPLFLNYDMKALPEIFKRALRGKPLEWLALICLADTNDFIEMISSLDGQQPLRRLHCFYDTNSLTDLPYRLPAVHRNNLHYITFHLYKRSSDWSSVLNLPRQFSQLSTLELNICDIPKLHFSVNDAVEAIIAYLSILDEENSPRSQRFKLILRAEVLDRSGCREVLEVLLNEQNCNVQCTAEGKYEIRFKGKGKAFIKVLLPQ